MQISFNNSHIELTTQEFIELLNGDALDHLISMLVIMQLPADGLKALGKPDAFNVSLYGDDIDSYRIDQLFKNLIDLSTEDEDEDL